VLWLANAVVLLVCFAGPLVTVGRSHAKSVASLDVYRLAASCAWIQRNSGARNPVLAEKHVGILNAAGVPWRRCISLRYPLRTICWWLAETGRVDDHVRKECTGSL